jgi:aldose sugar dehydrogenase
MQKISQNQLFLLISVACGTTGFTLFILLFGAFNHITLFSKQEDAPSLQGNYNNNLKIELVAEGLFSPTSMAFLDDHKILVLEKNTGLVRLISNGVLQDKPVLKLPIGARGERGLLGIAVVHKNDNKTDAVNTDVFLYLTTKSMNKNRSTITNDDQLRNRISKYEWNGQTLVNPTLVLDLPAIPGPYHNGGKLIIGPDHHLYIVIGDLAGPKTQAQNNKTGPPIDGTGGILRVTNDGKPVSYPPLGNKYPLNLYYAYGIRNSFGIDFDPVTGNLWDTENGEDKYDEINVVKPGFNSGWSKIMGPLSRNNISKVELVNFPDSYYSDPVFSWYHSIGVTDIEFLKSSKLGAKYKNNIFVGDINNGNLYYFQVNNNRTGLKFNSIGLKDKVVDNENELSEIIFASGFRGITDIKTGPDGYLYILSYLDDKLYRIVPR